MARNRLMANAYFLKMLELGQKETLTSEESEKYDEYKEKASYFDKKEFNDAVSEYKLNCLLALRARDADAIRKKVYDLADVVDSLPEEIRENNFYKKAINEMTDDGEHGTGLYVYEYKNTDSRPWHKMDPNTFKETERLFGSHKIE